MVVTGPDWLLVCQLTESTLSRSDPEISISSLLKQFRPERQGLSHFPYNITFLMGDVNSRKSVRSQKSVQDLDTSAK